MLLLRAYDDGTVLLSTAGVMFSVGLPLNVRIQRKRVGGFTDCVKKKEKSSFINNIYALWINQSVS